MHTHISSRPISQKQEPRYGDDKGPGNVRAGMGAQVLEAAGEAAVPSPENVLCAVRPGGLGVCPLQA